VRGEVFVPAAVVHKKGASLSYYLDQAGGMKDEADGEQGRCDSAERQKMGKRMVHLFLIRIPWAEVRYFVPKKLKQKPKRSQFSGIGRPLWQVLAAITIGIIQITK